MPSRKVMVWASRCLDLEVVALALGARVQKSDHPVPGRQQAEVLDLDVLEAARQQFDDVPRRLGAPVRPLGQVGVVDLDVVREEGHDALDAIAVEGLENALVGLDVVPHGHP